MELNPYIFSLLSETWSSEEGLSILLDDNEVSEFKERGVNHSFTVYSANISKAHDKHPSATNSSSQPPPLAASFPLVWLLPHSRSGYWTKANLPGSLPCLKSPVAPSCLQWNSKLHTWHTPPSWLSHHPYLQPQSFPLSNKHPITQM